ncbi:MAG: hypothetical protein GY793_00665 [Proteobacteria bacterium]|nr:hypothetical protein [Pseudomonadota bacterium]
MSSGFRDCPCGKIPIELTIEEGYTCKHAWVAGDCCGGWSIEFRTNYYETDTLECMELATLAWNNAIRAI